ncbi:MAG TPA: hypothetical protein VGN14_14425 [Candidatus Elarobacter sp.]
MSEQLQEAASTPLYTIVSQKYETPWDDQLQKAVKGVTLTVRWTATGNIIPVFVSDANYTPAQVDAAIKAAGARDQAIAQLGAA